MKTREELEKELQTKLNIVSTVEYLVAIPLISAAFHFHFVTGVMCTCGYFGSKIGTMWQNYILNKGNL